MKKEYAIYKGEELLGIGTSKELAEKLNIKVKSLLFYATPTYKKRTSEKKGKRVVKIEVNYDY